jgi:flagellar hook assembly protein FlgD
LVKSLFNETKAAGQHSVTWTGDNVNGNLLANGIYFVRLQSGTENQKAKLVLLR